MGAAPCSCRGSSPPARSVCLSGELGQSPLPPQRWAGTVPAWHGLHGLGCVAPGPCGERAQALPTLPSTPNMMHLLFVSLSVSVSLWVDLGSSASSLCRCQPLPSFS